MKRRILLFSVLFAMAQFFALNAQSDVTDTYLTNASFDTDPSFDINATDNIATDGENRVRDITGWTSSFVEGSNIVGATFEYGTAATLNGYAAPTQDSDAGTSGASLGVQASWGNYVSYSQSATLQPGTYTISCKAYNSHESNTSTQSLLAWIPNSGTSTTSSLTSFPVATWTTDEITFVVLSETIGTIQVGVKDIAGGSGSNPRLFIDHVQLLVSQEVDKTSLQALVDEATNMNSNQEAVPEGSTVYTELNTAITAAQAVLDNTQATLAEVVAQEDAMELAITNVNNAIELQQKISTWTTFPYDATSEIENPSFETGNTDGWVNVGGFVGQNNTSFSLKEGTYYVEKWKSASEGGWSGLKLSQVIENIPNGVYKVTAAALNNTEGTGGAFVYANDSTAEVLSTSEYNLQVVVENNTLEVGYDIVNSGNYIAVDNFRLSYLGEGTPVLEVTEESLAFDEVRTSATFNVSGYNLTDDITITAPAGFSVDVATISADASNETITVTFDPSAVASGNIELTSGTTSASVAVNGYLNSECFVPLFDDGRTNLIPDPYLSSMEGFGGWGNRALNFDQNFVYCGAASVKVSGSNGGSLDVDLAGLLKPSTSYLVKAMIYVDGTGQYQIGLDRVAASAMETQTTSVDQWEEMKFIIKTTDTYADNGIMYFNNYNVGGTLGFIDNWEMYEISSDATLSEITLNVGSLEVTFDPATTTYTATVPGETTLVTVGATATNAGAVITGTGDIDVSTGSGVATIIVTAEDETEITYTVTINVDNSTSISKTDKSLVKVFPTVTTSAFNVEFSEKPGMIKVYSLSGQLIKTVKATSSTETVQLTTNGIYLVEVESNGTTSILKVIKK